MRTVPLLCVLVAGVLVVVIVLLWRRARVREQQQHYQHVVVPSIRRLKDAGRDACLVQQRASTTDVSLVRHLDDLCVASDESSLWHRLYLMARVYKRGQFPVYRPDDQTADACCRAILLHAPRDQGDTRVAAASLMYADPVAADDRRGDDLPTQYADLLIGRCMASSRQCGDPRPAERAAERHPLVPRAPPPPLIADDRQNAHDHGVVSSARRVLRAIPAGRHVPDTDVETAIADGDMSDETKAAAIVAYDSLRHEVDSPVFAMSEKEAFDRVWRRASSPDLVVHGLASMIEDGQPVCHTGKMTRLAGVLDSVGTGDEVGVQPLWAHKEIMTSRAAAIRDDVLKGVDADGRRAYDEGRGQAVEEEMRRSFASWAEEYVAEHGLSTHVMTPIIDAIQAGF